MSMLSEEIPNCAEILATQKRNPTDNYSVTAPGTEEASARAWPSPDHILLLTACPPHPLSCIPQPTLSNLHPAT